MTADTPTPALVAEAERLALLYDKWSGHPGVVRTLRALAARVVEVERARDAMIDAQHEAIRAHTAARARAERAEAALREQRWLVALIADWGCPVNETTNEPEPAIGHPGTIAINAARAALAATEQRGEAGGE